MKKSIFWAALVSLLLASLVMGQQNATVNIIIVVNPAGTPKTYDLTWTASVSPNVAGYNAFSAAQSGGPYKQLNGSLITVLTYQVVCTGTCFYVVTTVSSVGQSPYSKEAKTP